MEEQRKMIRRVGQETLRDQTRATNSIEHMVSSQPGLIHQVTEALTHTRFWAATIFMDYYYNYCYTKIMRGEIIQALFRHPRVQGMLLFPVSGPYAMSEL